jgi:hypothetical protein
MASIKQTLQTSIKDCNGRIITDAIEKANTFNSYYSTVFSNEGDIPYIYRVKKQTIHSPPILKQLGEGLKR